MLTCSLISHNPMPQRPIHSPHFAWAIDRIPSRTMPSTAHTAWIANSFLKYCVTLLRTNRTLHSQHFLHIIVQTVIETRRPVSNNKKCILLWNVTDRTTSKINTTLEKPQLNREISTCHFLITESKPHNNACSAYLVREFQLTVKHWCRRICHAVSYADRSRWLTTSNQQLFHYYSISMIHWSIQPYQ